MDYIILVPKILLFVIFVGLCGAAVLGHALIWKIVFIRLLWRTKGYVEEHDEAIRQGAASISRRFCQAASVAGGALDEAEVRYAALECVVCGGSVPQTANFCPSCGRAPDGARQSESWQGDPPPVRVRVLKECRACRKTWAEDGDFCPHCGTQHGYR